MTKPAMATLLIAQAAFDDIAALNAIAAGNNSFKAPDYFARCLQEQAEGRRLVHIARLDGVPAGYGMLNWHPQYALYRRMDIPEIQDLNVMPHFRKQGIATALIHGFEEIARGAGRGDMGISVGLYADYGAAQRLYIKMGYVPDGYGVTYDRQPVRVGEIRPVDDELCLMLVKSLC